MSEEKPIEVLEIVRMGHPVLRGRSRELAPEEVLSPEIQRLIDLMIPTMRHADGVGLAAPQVAAPVRIAVVEVPEDPKRYPDAPKFGLGVYINPEIEVLDEGEQGYWEGCLSVPGLRGYVERPRKIRVRYLDREARPQELVAEGFPATVFQHEFDHLDGVLFIDRIRDKSKLAYIEEYARYHIPKEERQQSAQEV